MDSLDSAPVTSPALLPPLLARIDALVAVTGAASSVPSDDRYHDLRQEVDKLSALAGGEVDWRKIAALGDTLTLEVGKDLGVIAYVALARQRMLELDGLLAGLYSLARLLRAPPALLTPAKPRGRASAIEWLLARIHSAVQTQALPPAWAADLEPAIRELRGAAREALGDLAPSFGPLMQAMHGLRERAGPESVAPEASPVAPAAGSPASSVPLAVPASPGPSAPLAGPVTASAVPSVTLAVPAVEPEPASVPAAPACFAEAAAWLAPLAGASPCGVDPAGSEAFIDVQDQLARLASPSGGAVDWARVEAGSSAVLLGLSKDLRAAIWFTLARAHRGGPTGLAVGLAVVIGLLETFGEALYPRKARSTRDQSEWLIKHAATALAGSQATVEAPLLATLR
ncbi:MAG TPA: type VI secretion system ImpA family N-terminal domain-containing protein, partial [Nannocystis sp.]